MALNLRCEEGIDGIFGGIYWFSGEVMHEVVSDNDAWQTWEMFHVRLHDTTRPFLELIEQGAPETALQRAWFCTEQAWNTWAMNIGWGGMIGLPDWEGVLAAIHTADKDGRDPAAELDSVFDEVTLTPILESGHTTPLLIGDWPPAAVEFIFAQHGEDFDWRTLTEYLTDLLQRNDFREYIAGLGHPAWFGYVGTDGETLMVLWSACVEECPLAPDGDLGVPLAGRLHSNMATDVGSIGTCYVLPPRVRHELQAIQDQVDRDEEERLRRAAIAVTPYNAQYYADDEENEAYAP